MKIILFVVLASILSFTQGQYTVVTYYPGVFNCSGASHRLEYKVNSSCVAEGCVNVGTSSRFYSCGDSIPVTPNTVDITTFPTSDCSGSFTSVGVYPQNVCIVGSSGYSKINCNGTYSCKDVLCNDCEVTSLPVSCKENASGRSSIYVCHSPSPSPSPSPSSLASLSFPVSLAWMLVVVIVVVIL